MAIEAVVSPPHLHRDPSGLAAGVCASDRWDTHSGTPVSLDREAARRRAFVRAITPTPLRVICLHRGCDFPFGLCTDQHELVLWLSCAAERARCMPHVPFGR